MNRKEYWNDKYTQYWQEVTAEANDNTVKISKVEKITSGDYKAPGEKVITELFDQLGCIKSDKVLDYGCGFGRFFPYFNQKSNYYGIDISDSMIRKCKEIFPENEEKFSVAEGERLPFSDNTFDKVVCYGVFDACYQESALSEMLRVTKDEGLILVTGKNCNYHIDDEQAYIAENAAREKGHPNYFTDVNSMVSQMKNKIELVNQRYYEYRGDMGKNKFSNEIRKAFYEWAFIIRKKTTDKFNFEHFSLEYSNTWYLIEAKKEE